MKTMLALVLLVAAPGFAAAQTSKDDLKKLAKAGLSDEVILAFLKSKGPATNLSSDDLIELKTAGLSDKVLAAMLEPATKAPAAKELPTTPATEEASPVVIVPPVTYATGYYSYPAAYYSLGINYGYGYGYCYPRYSYYRCAPTYYRSYYRPCAPRVSVNFSGGRIVRHGSFGRVRW